MPPAVDLSRIDPYGEWQNAPSHPTIARLLTEPLGVYADSIAVLRGTRPSDNAHEAHVWWANPENRAHLLNALLRRGDRTLAEVERDADLRPGKVYAYLKSFEISFRARPRKHVLAMDQHGDLHEAHVTRIDAKEPTLANLRLHAYPDVVRGRWSASNACFRLIEPLDQPFGMLPIPIAARVVHVHVVDLAKALARAGCGGTGNVYIAHLARLFPDPWWIEDAHRAYARHLEDDTRQLAHVIDAERARARAREHRRQVQYALAP